jgi:hypothetical protein
MAKLTYQTAVVSLVQFITLTVLGVPNAIVSIVTTCHADNGDCVSNSLVSLIYFLLTAAWFGIILFLGYTAQKRRSGKIAVLLIGSEFLTLAVAGFVNFPHDSNFLDKGTSLIDALLSLWVIYLAFRLIMARGGRIVNTSGRMRRRRKIT